MRPPTTDVEVVKGISHAETFGSTLTENTMLTKRIAAVYDGVGEIHS